MENFANRGSAFVGAAVVAAVAVLRTGCWGVPRAAIRADAVGLAACLMAFVVTNSAMQAHDQR